MRSERSGFVVLIYWYLQDSVIMKLPKILLEPNILDSLDVDRFTCSIIYPQVIRIRLYTNICPMVCAESVPGKAKCGASQSEIDYQISWRH